MLLPALKRAAQLAEEAALVDVLSDGRLDLGVGAGYRVPEFEAFGADMRRRYELVETRVREVRELWATGHGRARPGAGPGAVVGRLLRPARRRASRAGWAWACSRRSPSWCPRTSRAWPRAAIRRRRHATRSRGTSCSPTTPRPPGRASPQHLAYAWDSYGRYLVEGTDQPLPPPVDPEQMRAVGSGMGDGGAFFMVLTPEQAAEFLRGVVERIPLEETFFWASIAGMPEDLEERHVELVCTELRPLVADLGA